MGRSRTIGIDASRWSFEHLTGTETYTRQLLTAMASLDIDEPVELYLNAATVPAGLPALGRPICMPSPRLWTHARLSWRMARHAPGVLFVPAHVVPAVHPRSVVTVHDLGYLIEPDSHPPRQRRMLDLTTRWSVRAASHIIAISAATKRDLVDYYGVDPARVTVAHHGVNETLAPAPESEIDRVRKSLSLPERYVLAVGTIHPRKNLARLASAVQRVRVTQPDLKLVVAGKRGWLSDQVETEIQQSGSAGAVQFLGYVEDRDLPALYSGAEIFGMPSLYEGFGMPLLEAMACGVPVIAGNGSALPEVGGDAALYVDVRDVGGMSAAIDRVLTDAAMRASLVERGLRHAATFSWRTTAERTLAILRDARDADTDTAARTPPYH